MRNVLKITFILLFLIPCARSMAQSNAIDIIPSTVKNNKFKDIYERYSDRNYDFDKDFIDSVAGLPKAYVLRYDSVGNKQFVVYSDNKYDSELGYWVGISNDHGHTWQRYYTGLGANRPYYIKYKTLVPLIKNDSTLEIEIAQLKQTSQEELPVKSAGFAIVTDNLLLQININELVKDSDKDGLTDIEEEKLFTNPFLRDSDTDGIPDAQDKNPRHKDLKNKYTALYRYFVNLSGMKLNDTVNFNDFRSHSADKYPGLISVTYLIVTDDTNIANLCGTDNTYIILNSKEWELYSKKFSSIPRRIDIFPLKPVKNKLHQYHVSIDEHMWGNSYIVIQKKDRWIIKFAGGWQV